MGIHSQKVLHRDLKLENMLLSSNMVVKIGDFGLATSFADNRPGSLVGTLDYMAPEVLKKKEYSTASDVWSIGCMVFELMCGAPPFEAESVTATSSRTVITRFPLISPGWVKSFFSPCSAQILIA